MKNFPIPTKPFAAVLAGAIALILPATAAEPTDVSETREKPLVLLESVKKRELESQIAVKEIELKRLNEDLQKRQNEQTALQQSMDSIAIAIADSSDLLEQYLARKKHLTRALELTNQRIEAERLKVDGLKTLSDAQAKERDHVAKQFETTSIRANIEGANFRILSQKQNPPAATPAAEGAAEPAKDAAASKDTVAKLLAEIAELKRKLERSERATSTAAKLAREAMANASDKLVQADAATAKAKKTADEWGLNENAEPVAERVEQEATATPTLDPATAKQEKEEAEKKQ